MKKPLFSHTHVAKLIDLTFNANFDQTDAATVKDIILNDLTIPAAAFEHLLALLDKSKNQEMRAFVLKVILKLFSSQYGEEACQIWNLNYGSSITESAILLKFLLNEMENMEKRTKVLLSKTAKQFCKANAKFLENPDKPVSNRKAMEWVDDMCKDILNGGKVNSKKSQSSKKSNSNSPAKKSFLGLVFNLIWYCAIWYFLIGFMQDLSSVNYQWSKTSSRRFLASAHPMVEKYLPVIETNMNTASDFFVSKTSEIYGSLHDLAPKQFDLLEEYMSIGSDKISDFCKEYIMPNLISGFDFIDSKIVECYLWIKANQYDLKFMEFFEAFSNFLATIGEKILLLSEKVILSLEQIQKDAPAYFSGVKSVIINYYHGLQLAVGKFILKMQPLVVEYCGIISKKLIEGSLFAIEKLDEFLVVASSFWKEFSGKYLTEVVSLFNQGIEKTVEIVGPYWNLLEQQFFQVFDHVMELINGQ